MVYVRQETEDVYTPLHLVPPTVTGLISAIENKYKINATNIRYLYRKNKDGIVAKIDDDMLRHYCNEDVFLMQVNIYIPRLSYGIRTQKQIRFDPKLLKFIFNPPTSYNLI